MSGVLGEGHALLVLLIAGFLPNEIWRMLGLWLGGGVNEGSELLVWVRAVATAILAGVIAQILVQPPGSLANGGSADTVGRLKTPPGNSMNLRARSALICCFGIVTAFAAAPEARTAEFPARPIKLVVPYAAGGPTDVLGRLVGEFLGRDLKQAVFVENKAGAQGAIGAEAVARSEPDGYTLLVTAASIIVLNPVLYKKLPYDPKDFRMLALVTDLPVVMEVHPSVPAKTVAE